MKNIWKTSVTTKIAGALFIGAIEYLGGLILGSVFDGWAKMSNGDKLAWGIPVFLVLFSLFLFFSPAIEKWINSLGSKKQNLQKNIEELGIKIEKLTKLRVEWEKLSDKEIEDIISKWATIPYTAVIPRPDDASLFSFAVIGRDGVPVNIFRLKKHPDHVAFASMADLTQGDLVKFRTAFDSLEPASQVDLLSKLRLEMVRLGINSAGITLPFKNVALIVNVPLNDLSDDVYFRERISFVRKANMLLLTLMGQHLINAGKIGLQDLGFDDKAQNIKT